MVSRPSPAISAKVTFCYVNNMMCVKAVGLQGETSNVTAPVLLVGGVNVDPCPVAMKTEIDLSRSRVLRNFQALPREGHRRLKSPDRPQCLAKGAKVILTSQVSSYDDAERPAATTALNTQCQTRPGKACLRCARLSLECIYEAPDPKIRPPFPGWRSPSSVSSKPTLVPPGDKGPWRPVAREAPLNMSCNQCRCELLPHRCIGEC